MHTNWLKTWINKNVLNGRIIGIIFIFNLVILLAHLFRIPFVLIDNTTILLMVLVLVTPFASQLKKIKWGDFEAELSQDIEKLKKQTEEQQIIVETSEDSIRFDAIADQLHEIAIIDGVLALAKLRIEIELRLKRLLPYTTNGKVKSLYGISSLAMLLAFKEIITVKMRDLILDIAAVLNKAVHGDDTPSEADINKILDIGITIINELDGIFYDKLVEPISKETISKELLETYEDAKYEVTSVVPLADKPYINKRILTLEQLNRFLDGYDGYAEFLVAIKKI